MDQIGTIKGTSQLFFNSLGNTASRRALPDGRLGLALGYSTTRSLGQAMGHGDLAVLGQLHIDNLHRFDVINDAMYVPSFGQVQST